ncbi:hypothetical protein DTO207G8_9072 [Paecilomyces variotii]|nr:hypothetical protein DTO207G8_9072 [Paecilomyces variotii]
MFIVSQRVWCVISMPVRPWNAANGLPPSLTLHFHALRSGRSPLLKQDEFPQPERQPKNSPNTDQPPVTLRAKPKARGNRISVRLKRSQRGDEATAGTAGALAAGYRRGFSRGSIPIN